MKRNNFLFLVFLFLISIFIISEICSAMPFEIFLQKGKNALVFNESEPFYVGDLVNLNSFIEAVSFYDSGKSVGYINFLGGIGENFIMAGGINYEIFMRENATLILPF